MTVMSLRQCLQMLVERRFPGYTVYYADAKRTKPKPPYITLKLKDAGMSTHPNEEWRDGASAKSHPSTAMLEINLYTPGVQINTDAGRGIYQNSAVDELTGFCLYLEFPATEVFLFETDLSIELEGKVRDVTAILDCVEPEFRAMAEFLVDFTSDVTDPFANEDGIWGNGQEVIATGYFTSVEITETED